MMNKNSIDFASRVVKGRIAETLIEEMFKKSGYQVYRFGYERLLENISQLKQEIIRSNTFERIRSIPDFLIVGPKGNIQLIEVKYRSSGEILPKELEKYAHFWEEARIILVTPEEPHFRISYINQFCKDGKLYSLENDKFTEIHPEIIKEFSKVVKRYFGKELEDSEKIKQ
jgi:hypothetical protein